MDSVVVRPYSRKTFSWLFACSLLAVLFAWIIIEPRSASDISFAYGGTAFFGTAALFYLAIVFPGSTYVKVDRQGIEYRFLWMQAYLLEWSDVQEITTANLDAGMSMKVGMVYIRLSSSGVAKFRRTLFQKIARGRFGYDRCLPNMFPPAEVARMLNSKKKEYEREANKPFHPILGSGATRRPSAGWTATLNGMGSFVAQWWYLITAGLIGLSISAWAGYAETAHRGTPPGVAASCSVIAGVALSPFAIAETDNVATDALWYFYTIFLGTVFLLSYFKPDRGFIFRGFQRLVEMTFFPRSKVWLLLMGFLFIGVGFYGLVRDYAV
jgi:hypothetical protein